MSALAEPDGPQAPVESQASRARHLAREGRRQNELLRVALAVIDAAALFSAFLIAIAVGGTNPFSETLRDLLAFSPLIPAWILVAGLSGHFDLRPNQTTHRTLLSVFNLVTGGTWLVFVVAQLAEFDWSTDAVMTFWATALSLVAAGRIAMGAVARRTSAYAENAVIVGAGTVGQLVGRKLRHHPELGLRLVGFVDASPKAMRTDLDDVPVLGSPSEIADIVSLYGIQRVIVAFSNDRHDLQLELIRALQDLDVSIDLVPRLFEAIGPTVGMYAIEGLPLVGLPTTRRRGSALLVKRMLDLVGASLVMLVLSPLFLWFALRIKLGSPGPVFFRQERLGQNQRPFTMLKFRTMVDGVDDAPHREYVRMIMDPTVAPRDNNLYKLERTAEVTKFGAWLRKRSLDELPQLINVLRGDMSLVGPRPCLAYEVELFEEPHFDRFSVPAGMTGLWQLTARGHSTLKEALDLDTIYTRNWSLSLDLRLLAQTALVFFHLGKTA